MFRSTTARVRSFVCVSQHSTWSTSSRSVQCENGSRRIVARLRLHRGEVDGVSMESRRRTGLEPPALEPELAQALAQRARRVLTDASAFELPRSDVDQAVEEGSGRHHRRAAADPPAVGELEPDHATALEPHVVRDPRDAPQARNRSEQPRHLDRVAAACRIARAATTPRVRGRDSAP